MKNINIYIILSLVFVFASCEKDFTNKNQITNDQVYSTEAGLIGVTVGMTQHFATSSYSPIVEVSGLTTREISTTSTFATPFELALGGKTLPNENAGVSRLWSRLLRDKAVAEELLENIDDVKEISATKKAGLKAYAKFFRAMTLGYLVQNFEKVPVSNSYDGNAVFGDRNEALGECVSLLESALNDIKVEGSSDFINGLIKDFSIKDVLYAYAARYNLFAGNWQDAIDAANNVDLTVISNWTYDSSINKNPVFQFSVFDNPDKRPTDNFGLKGDLVPEANDGRIAFYLSVLDSVGTEETGAWEIENLLGFFSTVSSSIPVYLPGEMLLIKAEAFAQLDDLSSAVSNLNLVREKTNDVFGVNAGLEAWSGDSDNKSAVMEEIYRNRCIELFYSGMRLEDSRRIHGDFTPAQEGSVFSERNRNYYPYPYEERLNNTNIPTDPEI